MTALRPIRPDDRLSVVDHLDELRTRIIVSGIALAVAFGICFWQNGPLIDALNRALPPAAKTGLGSQGNLNAQLGKDLLAISQGAGALVTGLGSSTAVSPEAVQGAKQIKVAAADAAKIFPKEQQQQAKPVTFGVGESFTTTLTVVGYFSILFTLPLLLYQIYAFVIPALSREERRVAIPSLLAAPLLFMAGVVFAFFEILPPAIHFLQGYNAQQFQILVQAKSYYRFEIFVMLGIGLAFQVPLLLLALQKVGLITSRTLTLNWRYATVLITIIVAALPGVDPVTMVFETIPLILLYLASIVLLKAVEHRTAKREAAEAARAAAGGDLDDL